jgi:hypothetical protein
MVKSKKDKLKRTRKRNSKKTKVKRKADKYYSNKMTHKKTRKRNRKTKKKNKNKKTVNTKLSRNQNKQLSYQFGGYVPMYKELKPITYEYTPINETAKKTITMNKLLNISDTPFGYEKPKSFKEAFENLQNHLDFCYGNPKPVIGSNIGGINIGDIKLNNIVIPSSHNTELTKYQLLHVNPEKKGNKDFKQYKYLGLEKDILTVDMDPITRFLYQYCINGVGCIELDLIGYTKKTTDTNGEINDITVSHCVTQHYPGGITRMLVRKFTNLINKSNEQCVHRLLLSEIIDNIVNFLKEHVCLLIINIDDSSLKVKDKYIMKDDELKNFKDKFDKLVDNLKQYSTFDFKTRNLNHFLNESSNGAVILRGAEGLLNEKTALKNLKQKEDTFTFKYKQVKLSQGFNKNLVEQVIADEIKGKLNETEKKEIRTNVNKKYETFTEYLNNSRKTLLFRVYPSDFSVREAKLRGFIGSDIKQIRKSTSEKADIASQMIDSELKKNYSYNILEMMYYGVHIPAINFQYYDENLAIYLALFSGIPFYYYHQDNRMQLTDNFLTILVEDKQQGDTQQEIPSHKLLAYYFTMEEHSKGQKNGGFCKIYEFEKIELISNTIIGKIFPVILLELTEGDKTYFSAHRISDLNTIKKFTFYKEGWIYDDLTPSEDYSKIIEIKISIFVDDFDI